MKRPRFKSFLALALMLATASSYGRPATASSAFAAAHSSARIGGFPRQNGAIANLQNNSFAHSGFPHAFHHGFGARHHFHGNRGFVSPFFFSYGYSPYPYYPYPYYGYPSYGYPYYSYSAPYYYPRYYRDYGYPGYSPYTVYDLGGGGGGGGQPATSSYYQLGRNWGQDLRRDVVTWDQFVDYLKKSLASAPSNERDEFRRGFTSGYGGNAEAALAKALDQAGLAARPESEKK